MNSADDATWLPEGAYVVLGACQVGDCDRVGWARPTYGQVVLEFVIPDSVSGLLGPAPNTIQPHVMEGVLRHVDWWCPVHGTGRHDDIARRWAEQVMADIRAWSANPTAPQWPNTGLDTRRYTHRDQDIDYTPGQGPTRFSMAVRQSK